MSSDGSVSSRMSQFGLYRTFDARTEEFLKLSKKRQIKQGCVCAAISTAVTVTVVVTVLLIYEYNVISEARRNSRKSNWLGLMNNSVDDSNLQEILNKEKIDIDKTTLKLLPILLKALNQNSYIDKIVEESTSPYTPNEKEVSTETVVTKNIFADTRNWMKTPHSRLYTIEYKSSPIVYFKNPTRNTEYFTKIRKIRDYQRILNYVDKMINDKNSLGTTQPMRNDYHTEQPYKVITPARKLKSTQKLVKKQKTILKTTTEEKPNNCKCSYKLSDIMYKLLNSIQQLLSYLSGSNPKEISRCKNNNLIMTSSPIPTTLQPLNPKPTINNVHKVITENYDVIESKLTRTPSYKTFLNRHKYTVDSPTKAFDIRRDYTVNAIMSLIKPNFNKRNKVDNSFESNDPFSTTDSYVKPLEMYNISKESSGKSYININTKTSTDTITTIADYILQKGTYDVSTDMRSSLSTFPEADFSDDDDYAETSEKTTILPNSFKQFNTYNIDSVKSNLKPERKKNISDKDKSSIFKGAKSNYNVFTNYGSMRKMGNLAPINKEAPILPNKHRLAPISNHSSRPPTTLPKLRSIFKINLTSTIKPITETTTKTCTTAAKITESSNKYFKQSYIGSTTTKEETEKILNENFSKENALKHIEEAIMILNNDTTTNEIVNYNTISTNTYQFEIVKPDEKTTLTKPLGRSTYLEMQRNDWKQSDNHDFDNDMNYIFD